MGVQVEDSPPLTIEPPPASESVGTGRPIAIQTNHAAGTPRAALAPALSAPALFGRYRIVRVLGSGAMGHVFLAEDIQLGRRVALKIPQTDCLEDADSIERFYREARAAATLRHPNICPVYDVGAIDGIHFLTMAFIEGELLSARIEKGEPIAERESALLIQKIAGALEIAHRSGIVHRDLKPANLMLDERHEPIVMDFGLARHHRAADDPRLTRTGMVMGTPAYMSPEQVAAEHDRIGPATDIYSLGVIFYELLTGQLPFSGTVGQLFKQILADEPQAPSALRPELDRQLEGICLKMMAREVGQRFGSMQEVVDALETWSGTKRSAATPSAHPIQKPARGTGGKRWLTVLMCAAILIPPAVPLALHIASLAVTGRAPTSLPVTGPTGSESDALPDPSAASDDASAQFVGIQAGQTRSDNRLNLELNWCPPGEFSMGLTADRAIDLQGSKVRVTLTRGFWLGRTEVTEGQWQQLMGTEPWKKDENVKSGCEYPAAVISWEDADEFCRRLTEQEHRAGRLPADWEYRLPTEAQWEYACRAGTKTHFCFGNDLQDLGPYGWHGSHQYPHLVGGKKPNNWGFFDMHGNVSEWCRDAMTPTLPGGRDPESTQPGEQRVHRGGHFRDAAAHCMSAWRLGSEPGTRGAEIGFRLAAVRVGQ